MLELMARRSPPLDRPALRGDVVVEALPPAARLVLRCRGEAGEVAGVELPAEQCRSVLSGSVAALRLGPDEWLLLAPEAEGEALAERIEGALANRRHAVVDVGHRQVAVAVSGPRAADTLNAGCPLDLRLAAFPVGMCTRTVLGKTEVVLWRTGADAFRVEVWRSFAPYLWRYLEEASREFRP